MYGSARRHLSYANVVATLALVFAMSGGALAAKHYLITSIKQIKPSVRHRLIGARGATGPTGLHGVPGPQGLPGPATGPAGGALSGSYPNPTIASGAVTQSTLAPDLEVAKVDGLHVGCRPGTVQLSGMCIETTDRPAATLVSAAKVCAEAGGALPPFLVLLSSSSNATLNLKAAAWGAEIYYDEVAHVVVGNYVTGGGGSGIGVNAETPTKSRCAYPMIY